MTAFGYLEWNDLLAKHYFNPSMAGREVLLYVNAGIIDKLGEPYNAGESDFIEAIKMGSPYAITGDLCNNAFRAFNKWRTRELEYPPYINYLVFFVLAGVTETGRAPHSYYPGIWKLLGEDLDKGTPRHFGRMISLWDDLEKWSREDKHEELGRFVARIRGGWINVGLPRSQTILSENERKNLTAFFSDTGLDPTDPPAHEYLQNLLSYYSLTYLENRTRKLLESKITDDSVLKKALLELVTEELEGWDGTVQEVNTGKTVVRKYTQMRLRLCIKLDSLASKAVISVRFKTGAMFPEDSVQFTREGDGRLWQCIESQLGWSTYLKDISKDPPERLDGASLDWEKGDRLVDESLKWHVTLRSAEVRLFRLRIDGLPEWIETQRLERGAEFLIAFKRSLQDKIVDWGKSCGWFEQKVVTGLPEGWLLYYGKEATQSCPGIGILILSSTIRLKLEGGIKADQGNVYFRFAPPRVILENSYGTELVLLNGKPLKNLKEESCVFELPEDILSGIPLRIEADAGDQRLSKVIRLADYDLPDSFDDMPCRGPSGEICSTGQPASVSGAHVNGFEPTESYNSPKIPALSDSIIFIGIKPGEICTSTGDNYPTEWSPVWAVVKKTRKRFRVVFCGKAHDLEKLKKLPEPAGNKADIKRWKSIVWHTRKRHDLPELIKVKSAWKDLMRLAKNV